MDRSRTPLLLATMLATVHVAAQLDTNLTVICAGCPFSQMLLEWDMDPGADQLVQLGDSLYFRSNDGMGGFGAPQLVTTLPAGEQFVLFEDADGDGDWDLFSQADSTMARKPVNAETANPGNNLMSDCRGLV